MTRPNILLVILDSARARNLSIYNYERETTPFLEEFLHESTLYEQARSPSIHSIASHVSMFTGLYVPQHNVSEYSVDIDVDTTIWKELETSYGYKTGLFTPNRIVGSASNLSEAFSYAELADFKPSQRRRDKIFSDAYGVKDTKEHLSVWGNLHQALSDDARIKSLMNCGWAALTKVEDALRGVPNNNALPGHRFADGFLRWQSNQDEPWAACVNLMDTHSPYLPADEYNRWGDDDAFGMQGSSSFTVGELLKDGQLWDVLPRLESLYDGAILQADDIVRDIISGLKQDDQADNTLIIITSDHGEGFGETNRLNPRIRIGGHSYGIHEVLTHVPLIVQYPEQKEPNTVTGPASLTNIPAAIRAEVEDDGGEDRFTADLVYSSTKRLLPDAVDRFPNVDDIEQYIGPWRAVYEAHDGSVRKYAMNRDHAVTLDITSPHDCVEVSADAAEKVKKEYSKIEDATDFKYSTRDRISDDLESSLKDLGYL